MCTGRGVSVCLQVWCIALVTHQRLLSLSLHLHSIANSTWQLVPVIFSLPASLSLIHTYRGLCAFCHPDTSVLHKERELLKVTKIPFSSSLVLIISLYDSGNQ